MKKAFVACSLVLLWCGCVTQNPDQPRQHKIHIAGRIVGSSYVSPRGEFSVPIPVSPEVGGRVLHDDAESVTFYDNWGSKISFYSRSFTSQSALVTPPRSEARANAMEFFMKDIYGSSIAPHYHPDILDGTVTFIFLKPVGPKTGVATFIHKQRIFLVETDLLPGVQLLSKSDDESDASRDAWLENRAIELLRSMDIK